MSHLDPFALIRTAVDRSKAALTPAPRGAASPSNGPPPLPTAGPASRDSLSLEEGFFQEGIDGHAESIPDDSSPGLTVASPFAGAAAESAREAHETIPPASHNDVLPEMEVEPEDPARTRRRNAARAGAAWGAAGALVLAAVVVCVSPRREARSAAAHATPTPVETTSAPATVTPSLDTTPAQAPPPLPVAVTPPAPSLGAAASTPGAAPMGTASCRSGMLPSAVGHASCVDVADRFLCARDPRTRALRPAGCIEAKSPKAACESRGARLATAAEQQRAGGRRKSGTGAFRCAAGR